MKTPVENYGYVTPEMRELVNEIRTWMDQLAPAPASFREDGMWSCHAIVRAAMHKWNLSDDGWRVCDGYFMGNYSHSWLTKKLTAREGLIMDVYPVASIGGPLLIEAMSPASPWRTLYEENSVAFADRLEIMRRESILCLRGG